MTADINLTPASQARIDRFVNWFIRSEYVQNWTSEKDSDFINEPERADAAEFGADGKTHAEVIEDWREAFRAWVMYGRARRNTMSYGYDRFEAAVETHFDATEAWHEKAGSLNQEIG
jgi:hypothetical protein